ncbi:MAG: DHA2 family efflux MFS transporter permease subunit [Candidatus Accumulibacter sp.]|jgi:DHA2 family multidrug resistance protein|nr:DHA2 family efflux MFS transporter permease subunit [Accumulibacter sp.]
MPPPAAPAGPPPLEGGARALATVALAMATFMNVLDTTIANVSIPTIAGDIGVSANQGTWVITSFAVANAISVPLTGYLARRFGQVRVFVWSTLLFVATSWLCGLSRSIEMLVAFRVAQGLVAGPMIPLSQALLLQCYPRAKAGTALAVWSMTTTVAPVIGPILGGWISDNLSWSWIFYINVPAGLIAAGMTWMMLRRRELPTVRLPVDAVGLALLVIWVGAMQLVLDRGKELDWFGSAEIVTLAILSAVGFCFFLVWELTERHPIVDLHLFSRRSFTFGTLALSLGFGVFFANTVVQPLWMQQYMGYTATWAGLAIAPSGLLAIVFMPLVGKFMGRVDPRAFATASFVILALASFLRAHFNTDMSFVDMILPQLIQGIAMAGFFVPLSAILISGLDPAQMAAAAGLSNFARITASAFGASISMTLWENRAALHHAQLAEAINPYRPATQMALEALRQQGMSQEQALAAINRSIDAQAATLSATEFFWVSGLLFLALVALALLSKPARPSSGG